MQAKRGEIREGCLASADPAAALAAIIRGPASTTVALAATAAAGPPAMCSCFH